MRRSNRTTLGTSWGTAQPGAGGGADRDEEARLTAVLGDVALYGRTRVLGFNPRFIKRWLIFHRQCSCFASQRPCGAGVGQRDPAMLLKRGLRKVAWEIGRESPQSPPNSDKIRYSCG